MKCNYCGSPEICKGGYPEGCFLENEITKIHYKSLLREFMVRTQYVPPVNGEECSKFELNFLGSTERETLLDALKMIVEELENNPYI
jgi:hypothetical protein